MQELTSISITLKSYPAGKLTCSKNGNSYKWYNSDGKNRVYIPKKKRAFAEQLARKRYLACRKEDLERELSAIDMYLRHHHDYEAFHMLEEASPFFELLSHQFKSPEGIIREWLTEKFNTNTHHPESLTHKTVSGVTVRSKSEAIIATILHFNSIPFRYECMLDLGNTTFYPDFTILHPLTGELIYWEHFGLIDDESYRENFFSKLDLYIRNGIIPTRNLIMTFETHDMPLQTDYVNEIVKYYFL